MITGTVSAHLVRHLRATALRYGVDPRSVDTLPGMDPQTLADDLIRVPTRTGIRIWELISMLGIDAVGVLSGAAVGPGTLHAWDYLFATGPTLADGFQVAGDLFAVVTDPAVGMEVARHGDLLTARYVGIYTDAITRWTSEFCMAMLLRKVQDATGEETTPVRVAFSGPAPRGHRYLVDAFGTTNIEFDAPASEITFLDANAAAQRVTHDPVLDQIITRYARMTMESATTAPDWHATFRSHVSEALERNEASLDTVAGRLFMSPRTLQRRLEERDTNWRDEVEAVRHSQTRRLLTETDLTVGSVASRVGYADARTLRKAFVRWTGQTPDAYRRATRV